MMTPVNSRRAAGGGGGVGAAHGLDGAGGQREGCLQFACARSCRARVNEEKEERKKNHQPRKTNPGAGRYGVTRTTRRTTVRPSVGMLEQPSTAGEQPQPPGRPFQDTKRGSSQEPCSAEADATQKYAEVIQCTCVLRMYVRAR